MNYSAVSEHLTTDKFKATIKSFLNNINDITPIPPFP